MHSALRNSTASTPIYRQETETPTKWYSLDSGWGHHPQPQVAEQMWVMLSIPVNGHILDELVGDVVSQDNSPW